MSRRGTPVPSVSRAIAPTRSSATRSSVSICRRMWSLACRAGCCDGRPKRASPRTRASRLRKDGSRFWASVVITALHDKSGRLRGFAKVTRDISEQKHVEQSMAILADASRLLAESLDLEQILFAITRMGVPSFADGVVILTRDPEGEPRSRAVPRGEPGVARCLSGSAAQGRLSRGSSQPPGDANGTLRAPSQVDAGVGSRPGDGRRGGVP